MNIDRLPIDDILRTVAYTWCLYVSVQIEEQVSVLSEVFKFVAIVGFGIDGMSEHTMCQQIDYTQGYSGGIV